MAQRKRCNLCGWAKPTAQTKYNDELKCTKRKIVVYADDSCDLFKRMENAGHVPKIDGDQLFMIPKRRGLK